MAQTNVPGQARPGVSAGPTSEFSLFFTVKRGDAGAIPEALGEPQSSPGP